jgi:uncharacterized phage protein (TIGR01671 family)
MREIKFRAWHKCKMSDPFGIFEYASDKDSDWGEQELPFEFSFENSEAELMQFTGLCDKNGKEIYEGDILQYRLGGLSGLFDVRFDGNGFWIKDGKTGSNFFPNSEFVEVVGNIYENGDLPKEAR